VRARREYVIEHKVPIERHVEAERATRDLVTELEPRVQELLGGIPGHGMQLLVSLAALQLGAAESQGTGGDEARPARRRRRAHAIPQQVRDVSRN
jgi:hypothetical protein